MQNIGAIEPKFESFEEIKKLGNAALFITQKIHGSNAQIFIFPVHKYEHHGENNWVETTEILHYDLKCGSRSRWIAPGNDNYGFAEFVYANKQEFIEKLGVGRHYGEWAGPGINSGEGLSEKTFVLFDHWKFPPERALPLRTVVVPVLYQGPFDLAKVEECMKDLKENGSKLVAGYMRPEGVVVRVKGERYKVVFDAEETQWKHAEKNYRKDKQKELSDIAEKFGHLLQPIRLEKLLSRDEKYLREFPRSMGLIANDYFEDLVKEGQVTGTEAEIKGVRNFMGKLVFAFIKDVVEKQVSA